MGKVEHVDDVRGWLAEEGREIVLMTPSADDAAAWAADGTARVVIRRWAETLSGRGYAEYLGTVPTVRDGRSVRVTDARRISADRVMARTWTVRLAGEVA